MTLNRTLSIAILWITFLPFFASADILLQQIVETGQEGESVATYMNQPLFATSTYPTCDSIPAWAVTSISFKTYDNGSGSGPSQVFGGFSSSDNGGATPSPATWAYWQATSTNSHSFDGDAGTVRQWNFSPSVYLPDLCPDSGLGLPFGGGASWFRFGIGVTAAIAIPFDLAFNSADVFTDTGRPRLGNGQLSSGEYYFIIEGVELSGGINTRIDFVEPFDGEVVATSSTATFGAIGYINSDDFEDDMLIEIRYAPYSAAQSAIGSPEAAFTTLDFPITGAGPFDVSTTSPLLTSGEYYMTTKIKSSSVTNDVLAFLGFGQFANFGIVQSTTTEFTATFSNAFDILVASTTESVNNYLASSTVSVASCNTWTGFDLLDCLNLLFVPQLQPIQQALSSFKNEFLSYMPWGYLTRLVTIFATTESTTLPLLPLTLPDLNGERHTFATIDPEDFIDGAVAVSAEIVDPVSGLNAQEMAQPWYRLILGLMVILTIVVDVGGIVNHRHREA